MSVSPTARGAGLGKKLVRVGGRVSNSRSLKEVRHKGTVESVGRYHTMHADVHSSGDFMPDNAGTSG